MRKNLVFAVLVLFGLVGKSSGQDPAFSQFFSSPLNVNPALTANINADWRGISNFRDQWVGPASPYVTGTVSFDSKIFHRKYLNVEESDNVAGLGGMMMFDYAMSGVVRSTYASLDASYRVKLAEGDFKHKLAAGIGIMYGKRRMDFGRVDFEEQFTGYGFNTNLPTGEAALSNMKGYFSISAGLTYSMSNENSNLDIGVAAYHLNHPKQTFLEDKNQYVPIRKVIHANYERYVNDRVILFLNGIYQYQKAANYFSIGGAGGYILTDQNDIVVNAGLWYWSNNAIVPYVGLAYRSFQFGVSYDFTISKLNEAPRKPNTWEVSLILRGIREFDKTLLCPWK